MLSKFIFSLVDLIVLLFVFALLALEPVWNYLVGGGTPLKTCTLPPLWAFIIGIYKKGSTMSVRHPGLILLDTVSAGHKSLKKIFDRRSGNRHYSTIGLPCQAGAMQSPSGQLA